MAESPLTMVLHGGMSGSVLFIVMRYLMGQVLEKALARSTFAGLLIAMYMVVFGHDLPLRSNINPWLC